MSQCWCWLCGLGLIGWVGCGEPERSRTRTVEAGEQQSRPEPKDEVAKPARNIDMH